MAVANVNGKLSQLENATIGVDDRGFLYGDSLYEVVFFRQGIPIFWQEHFARMNRTAASMGMKISQSDDELRTEINRTLDYLGQKGGEIYVRWVITRGAGPITLNFQENEKTTFVIIAKKWVDKMDDDGKRVKVTNIRRNPTASLNPNMKSGNYLNNILAMKEANDEGYDDCLMLTTENLVAELSRSNMWFVIDNVVVSPKGGCLSGVTRSNIHTAISQSNSGLKSEDRDIHQDEIKNATEAFYSASSRDIWPIKEIKLLDGTTKHFPVGGGEVTRRLQRIFAQYVSNYCQENKTSFSA